MLNAAPTNSAEVENLAVKLTQGQPHPDITVGVHGGLVQWIAGNPFPIRVCGDDGFDLPDVDERGLPVRCFDSRAEYRRRARIMCHQIAAMRPFLQSLY